MKASRLSRLVGTLALATFCASSGDAADAQPLSQVFKRVKPSVVLIGTSERDVAAWGRAQREVPGLGSGVIISADGKVVTAAHVVQTADEITVELVTGDTVKARVVASEPEADVALLQLSHVPPQIVPAKLGNSDKAEVGDQIFVVGAPYGIGHSLTVGHISGRHRPNSLVRFLAPREGSGFVMAEFFQTDAAINPGNSGGPLFSLTGEVIGIVSHIVSKSGGFEGLGFVVTSNMVRRLLLERRAFWTGIDGYVLKGDLAMRFGLPQPIGFLVRRIAAGSPAVRFGLRGGTETATVGGRELVVGGDIILEVQGIRIHGWESYERIQDLLGGRGPGSPVTVMVLRDGRRLKLTGRLP